MEGRGEETAGGCRSTGAAPALLILTFIKSWPLSPRGFTKQEVKGRGAGKGIGRRRKP